MMKSVVMVSILGWMEEYIKENGSMEKYMAMDCIHGQMVNSTMVGIFRIKSKGLAFIDGQMVKSTRVDGIKACSMARGRLSTPRE